MAALHEPDDGYRHGRALAVGLILVMPLLCLLPLWIFSYQRRQHFIIDDLNRKRELSISSAVERIPAPRLQTQPRVDMELLRRQQMDELTSYGWVDPKAGLVRIPIDEAMRRYLQTPAQP